MTDAANDAALEANVSLVAADVHDKRGEGDNARGESGNDSAGVAEDPGIGRRC